MLAYFASNGVEGPAFAFVVVCSFVCHSAALLFVIPQLSCLSFGCRSLFVIPQRSGGICFCRCRCFLLVILRRRRRTCFSHLPLPLPSLVFGCRSGEARISVFAFAGAIASEIDPGFQPRHLSPAQTVSEDVETLTHGRAKLQLRRKQPRRRRLRSPKDIANKLIVCPPQISQKYCQPPDPLEKPTTQTPPSLTQPRKNGH